MFYKRPSLRRGGITNNIKQNNKRIKDKQRV